MVMPCEEAIWYTLPAVRADLSKALVERGMTQKQVADLLELTPPAVSQYLSRKRGGKAKSDRKYRDFVEVAADRIISSKKPFDVKSIICKCCTLARS